MTVLALMLVAGASYFTAESVGGGALALVALLASTAFAFGLTSIIPGGNKVPGAFVRITLGVGVGSPGSAPKKVLLYGNATSSGTATDEVVYQVTGIDQAKTLFGPGSELALMCERALSAYETITLYAVAIADAGGTAANDDIVLADGPSTADGTYTIKVLGETVNVSIPSGSTITEAGDLIEAAINDQTDWPVTASNSSGTVTVTAKNTGPRGNLIRIETSGDVAAITETHLSGYLSSGATADDPQNALDAAVPARYDIHVAPYQDATGLADFKTHILAAADPVEGRRGRFIAASIDTLANTTTVATGLNEPRGQVVWHYNAWTPPSMIAAEHAARTANAYEASRRANTDGLAMLSTDPQSAEADWPTPTEINSALNNGISPLAVRNGIVELVRNVTSYSQDDSSNPDFRVIDVHYVEVADFIGDDVQSNFLAVFDDYALGVDVDGEMPEPGVATPNTIRDMVLDRLRFYGEGGGGPQYLVNVAALEDRVTVEADGTVAGRVNVEIPIDVIELLHQGGFDVRQVG